MNWYNLIPWCISGAMLIVAILSLKFSRRDKKLNELKAAQERIRNLENTIADYEDFDKHFKQVEEVCYGKNKDGSVNLDAGPYCYNCTRSTHVPKLLKKTSEGEGYCVTCKLPYIFNQQEHDQESRAQDRKYEENSILKNFNEDLF